MDQQPDPHSFERGLIEKSIDKLKKQLEEFHEMLVDASVATSGELNNKIRETRKKLTEMEARRRELQPPARETLENPQPTPTNSKPTDLPTSMLKNDFTELVRRYIGQGKTDEALALVRREIGRFDPTLVDDVVLLESSFQNNKNDYSVRGRISRDDYERKLAHINYALLEILQKPPAQAPGKQETYSSSSTKADKKERDQVVEPEMVFVEGGAFKMGNNDGRDEEKPLHTVILDDFCIGKYIITVAQFDAFIRDSAYITTAERENSSKIFDGGKWDNKKGVYWKHGIGGLPRPTNEYNHPVIHVSWLDAKEYCDWLSRQTGKKYRLPTEAEWEYAAKGGKETQDYEYSGGNNLNDVGWYIENSGMGTHAVGEKKGNELGIYDMSGNVREWCKDWYYEKYDGNSSPHNPIGVPSGAHRVIRGGSWSGKAQNCRSSSRGGDAPTDRAYSLGFRIAVGSELGDY